jgi:hypothetical protein
MIAEIRNNTRPKKDVSMMICTYVVLDARGCGHFDLALTPTLSPIGRGS